MFLLFTENFNSYTFFVEENHLPQKVYWIHKHLKKSSKQNDLMIEIQFKFISILSNS